MTSTQSTPDLILLDAQDHTEAHIAVLVGILQLGLPE